MPVAGRLRDVLGLARLGNGLLAAFAVLVGASVATPLGGAGGFAWASVAFAMLATILVTAFGNALNDVWDVAIDRTAHPERPLPAGRMGVAHASGWALAFLLGGLVAALAAGGAVLLAFAVANAALLAAYARWLKAVPLAGNLVVSVLVASAFLFGATTTGWWGWRWPGTSWAAWDSLWGVALLAMLANLARETAKGLEDAPHDRGRRTLARLSPQAARTFGTACLAAVAVLAVWLVREPAWPWWLSTPDTWEGARVAFLPDAMQPTPAVFGLWRWGVGASVPVFLAGAALLWRDPGRAQRVLKAAMLVAIVGYAWGALLAWQSW